MDGCYPSGIRCWCVKIQAMGQNSSNYYHLFCLSSQFLEEHLRFECRLGRPQLIRFEASRGCTVPDARLHKGGMVGAQGSCLSLVNNLHTYSAISSGKIMFELYILQTGFSGVHPCLCFDCETKKHQKTLSHFLLLAVALGWLPWFVAVIQRSEQIRWSLADVPGLTGNVASTWRPAHVERVERWGHQRWFVWWNFASRPLRLLISMCTWSSLARWLQSQRNRWWMMNLFGDRTCAKARSQNWDSEGQGIS